MASRKSKIVALGITAGVAGVGVIGYQAIAPQEPTQAGICVDQDSGTRLQDQDCENGSGYHGHPGWYFIPFGVIAPRVGARASGGSFSTPKGTSYVTGGVSNSGGTVDSSRISGGKTTTVRGGFGTKSGGSGS